MWPFPSRVEGDIVLLRSMLRWLVRSVQVGCFKRASCTSAGSLPDTQDLLAESF